MHIQALVFDNLQILDLRHVIMPVVQSVFHSELIECTFGYNTSVIPVAQVHSDTFVVVIDMAREACNEMEA